jgi:hypothetical protein
MRTTDKDDWILSGRVNNDLAMRIRQNRGATPRNPWSLLDSAFKRFPRLWLPKSGLLCVMDFCNLDLASRNLDLHLFL